MFTRKKRIYEVKASTLLENSIELGPLKDENHNQNWIQSPSGGRCLTWSKLCYNVKDSRKSQTVVLNNFSGFVRYGEMVAILGSSGSGKTTFLNCVTGASKPCSGSIEVNIAKERALSYVRQNVELHMYLTVEESLLFASRFKNDKPNVNHGKIVEEIIDSFLLNKCAKTRVIQCSGGERKRLSIALELVSNPSLLVLDEPTTGLDSYTTTQCIQLLKSWQSLTLSSILLTIHQPSVDTFMELDRIYVLSDGKCYYDGTPSGVVEYLKEQDIPCPDHYNSADFILTAISKGLPEVSGQCMDIDDNNDAFQSNNHNYSELQNSRFTFASFWTQATRIALCDLRDPQRLFFRILLYVFYPILLRVSCQQSALNLSPCFFSFQDDLWRTEESPQQRIDRKVDVIRNTNLFLFGAMLIFVGGPSIGALSVGTYFRCNYGELFNKWYSLISFFTAYVFVALVFAIIYTVTTSCLFLVVLTNLANFNSFFIFLLTNFGFCVCGDTLGLLLGVIFPTSLLNVLTFTEVVTYVHLFLSDLLIRSDMTVNALQTVLKYSPLRLLMQIQMKSIYPLEKCVIDDTKYFNLEQIVDFIKFYNARTNTRLDYLDDISVSTFEEYTGRNWTRSEANALIFQYNRNRTSIELLNEFWDNELNFVHQDLGLEENSVTTTVVSTTLLCISHLLLAYLVFKLRLKH